MIISVAQQMRFRVSATSRYNFELIPTLVIVEGEHRGEGRKERKTAEGRKKDTQVMFTQDILSPYLENLTGY